MTEIFIPFDQCIKVAILQIEQLFFNLDFKFRDPKFTYDAYPDQFYGGAVK